MPLEVYDFEPPNGPLRSSLFPGDDLSAWIGEWIEQAEAKATAAGLPTDGEAAHAYVLWRAYDLKCRTGTDPEHAPVKAIDPDGEGRVEYDTSATKRPDPCTLAADYRAAALALIDPTPVSPYADWPSVHSLR